MSYDAVAVSALRDLQQQLVASENDAAELGKQVDDARAETKAARRQADEDVSQRDLESSQLRQLIIELKDELQQAVREQDHSQECNNSLRRDLTAAHDEISSVKASNATLEDTMSLRLTDIRQLEQEKSGYHSTIRDLTSRADALEQQLAESKDDLRQAESRAAEAYVAREEAQSAVRVAQTEARTASDNAASLQRSSEATTAELSTAQASLEESKEESKELRDALDKMREELAATYARAHSAEVAAASAAAAASAPAAALHTAAERMKQEVAVVRALALRGVDAEGTLDACEAALLRGFDRISRVAQAYETLKPQLCSAPNTPSHAKENLPDYSHSAASSVIGVAPLQDASNRKLAAPYTSVAPRPDSASGLRTFRDPPRSHSHFSQPASIASQERPVSAAAVPFTDHATGSADEPDVRMPHKHNKELTSAASTGIAAIQTSTDATPDYAEQPTAVPSEVAPLACMNDMHSAPDSSDQVAVVPEWFPQWFHDSFSNALHGYGGSLATIAMPNMHASISSHTPGVTLLATHTNTNSAAGSLPPHSQPASRGSSPQPPTAPTNPQPIPANPHVLVITNADSSSRGSNSRGASPSPQLLATNPPNRVQPPIPHPLATTQCYTSTIAAVHAGSAATAETSTTTAQQQLSVGVVGAAEGTNHRAAEPDNDVVPCSHTFIPTTTADATSCDQEVQDHASVQAAQELPQQHHQQQLQANVYGASEAAASNCVRPAPTGLDLTQKPTMTLSAPSGQLLDQSTLSTYPHRQVANDSTLPSVTAAAAYMNEECSRSAEGSRSCSLQHQHPQLQVVGTSHTSGAASPSLRHLPEASSHAPSHAYGHRSSTTSVPQAQCPPPAHACGVMQGQACVTQAAVPGASMGGRKHMYEINALSDRSQSAQSSKPPQIHGAHAEGPPMPHLWQRTQVDAAQRRSPDPSRPGHSVDSSQHNAQHTQHSSALASAAALAAEQQRCDAKHSSFNHSEAAYMHDFHAYRVHHQTSSEVGSKPQPWGPAMVAQQAHDEYLAVEGSMGGFASLNQHKRTHSSSATPPSPHAHHTSQAGALAEHSENFSRMHVNTHDRNPREREQMYAAQESWHSLHEACPQEQDFQQQTVSYPQRVHMESSSVLSASEVPNQEWLEEPSGLTMAEESSASLAGYYRSMDNSHPPPLHQMDSSTSVSTIVPFSGSSGAPGHLRTTAASRNRASQHSTTPPPIPTSHSTPRPSTTPGQPRRRHSSSGYNPSSSISSKTPRTAERAAQRSTQHVPTTKIAAIPIRSTRASRGHSKQPAGLAANRFAPVETSARPHSSTRGSGSTRRISTPKTPNSTTPVQPVRSRHSASDSQNETGERSATGQRPSEGGQAERMADLRSDLSRQDLQHDALLRQIAAAQDSRQRHNLQGDLKALRATMIHTGQQLMAINSRSC